MAASPSSRLSCTRPPLIVCVSSSTTAAVVKTSKFIWYSGHISHRHHSLELYHLYSFPRLIGLSGETSPGFLACGGIIVISDEAHVVVGAEIPLTEIGITARPIQGVPHRFTPIPYRVTPSQDQ